MNKIKKVLWVISILSLIGIVISYLYLPAQIPIHWNSNWEIDNWADKKFIFLLGLFPILVLLMFEFLPKIDPRWDNYKKHAKSYEILEIALVILMIILDWVSVLAALGLDPNMIKVAIPAVIGIMFLIIGNYLPKLKSNYFFGIKNPWTLSDDVVWRKTHKAGGYVFAITGILMVIMSLIQNATFNSLLLIVLLVGIIGINVYSYIIYRKLKINIK